MNIFTLAFREILYRPLLNLLVVLYQIPYIDFGIAILILTVLTKVLSWPLSKKAIENQKKSQKFQSRLKEVQERYKDDSVRLNEEMMRILKEEKFNPFSSFLPMIVQIIILIALYQVLKSVLSPEGLSLLYSFVKNPGKINPTFLKLFDLSQKNSFLAVLTGISQYFASKISFTFQPKTKEPRKGPREAEFLQKMMKNQMMYLLPLMTVFICWTLPAALTFYWFFSTLIGIFQQKIILKGKI